WTKTVSDGRFIFVMLSYAPEMLGSAGTEQHRRIRDTYPMSGLYQNDGSKKLLWVFHDYYYDDDGLTFASDGVHLIKARGYVRDFDADAISFFANGKVVRTWHVWELVSDHWQPQLERDALREAAMMGAPGQKPLTIFQWARSKSL